MIDFAWKVFNFLVLAGLVVWLVRKYDLFERVFGNYRRQIKAELRAAERHLTEARRLKDQTRAALTEAKTRAAEILEQAQAQAEREKAELLAAARAEVERLLAQARLAAEAELEHQLEQLRRETVEAMLARARERTAETITRRDHQRLVTAFLDELTEESLKI